MKLGIAVAPPEALPSAFVVFRYDLETSIKKARALGFDGVELALLHPGQIEPARIESLLRSSGLEIPMISTGQVFADGGLSFTHPDPRLREAAIARVKELVEVADRFRSMVNIGRVRGPVETGPARGDSEKRFLEALDAVAAHAEPRGITIAVEPVNRYELNFINRVDEAAEIIGRLGRANIKVMADVFHMNIEDRSIEGSLAAHLEQIAYIHVADSNRLAPGMGHLNFPNIIAVLESLKYTGYLTAEILPYPAPDEAAASAARYLKALVSR